MHTALDRLFALQEEMRAEIERINRCAAAGEALIATLIDTLDLHNDADAEPDADDELTAAENHGRGWLGMYANGAPDDAEDDNLADKSAIETHGMGFPQNHSPDDHEEDDPGEEEPDREIEAEDEPSLGSVGHIDQEDWAAGDRFIVDGEIDPTEPAGSTGLAEKQFDANHAAASAARDQAVRRKRTGLLASCDGDVIHMRCGYIVLGDVR
jgi:hypothetical protein